MLIVCFFIDHKKTPLKVFQRSFYCFSNSNDLNGIYRDCNFLFFNDLMFECYSIFHNNIQKIDSCGIG